MGTARRPPDAGKRRVEQYRHVVAPALVLWVMAAVVTVTLLKPGDVKEYMQYAHGALHTPLFHRLPNEYPAPALAVFLLPLLVPIPYPWAFAALAGVALIVLVTSYEGSGIPGWDVRSAGRLIIYLALGTVMVLAGRYDVFATAAAFLAVRAARGERWATAWTWSSIGFALKLFPAAFWPVFLIAEYRRTGRFPVRRLGWIAASAVVVAGVPMVLDRGAALNVVHYYLHRPSEIGSLPAGLSLLLDWHGTSWVGSFHSVNVVSALTSGLSAGVELAGVVACAWTWREQARGRIPLEAACLATLTFVMLGSKVISVQYLMWLMPLWALYRLRVTWLLASVANLVIFPYAAARQHFGYVPSHAFAVSLTLTLFARDVLVAAGTGAFLYAIVRARPAVPAAGLADGATAPG
jgi:hypothetical protein